MLEYMIHERTNSLLLNVPEPDRTATVLAKHKRLDHERFNLAAPYNVATVRKLWDSGVHVTSPIMRDYDWPGKYRPFDHQRVMASFLTLHKRAFNLSEMGVGKSAASLWAADALMKAGRVKKALILSPLPTLRRVWMNDIFDVLMHRSGAVIHGPRDKRLANLELDVDFYVMNHEGVKIEPVRQAIRNNPDIQLVIVDEGSMFRNNQTKGYKALVQMLREDQRLWWLTGTPCPNTPTDAWAQAKIINPAGVPKYFGGFRRMTMHQVSQFKWEPKRDAYKIAYAAMQPAIRYKKADCLDLPPMVVEDREVPISSEQKKAFDSMRKTLVAEKDATTISAVNAADKINKLRQILCGSVKEPETDRYVSLNAKPRMDVLIDTIGEAAAKVIVICPFKGALYEVEKAVAKHYSVGVLNGDVSAKKRDETILSFKTEKDPHVLLCHPRVMSHGLNLTEADTLIFYAPIYSNDEFQQVVERFNRFGQTRKMTVIRLGAHFLEWRIYQMVDAKKASQDSILSLYKSIVT